MLLILHLFTCLKIKMNLLNPRSRMFCRYELFGHLNHSRSQSFQNLIPNLIKTAFYSRYAQSQLQIMNDTTIRQTTELYRNISGS